MRTVILAFGVTGGPHANLRNSVRLMATATKLQLSVPTSEDMEDVGGLLATMTLFSDDSDFARGKKLFLKGDLGAGKRLECLTKTAE